MSEFTVSCQRKTIGFRHFSGKYKMETEAVIEESENNPTSYVHEDQPTFESEIYHGSSEQKLTDLKVVSVKEVRRIGHDRVKHSTVVAEGTKRADSEASDVVLSHFVGQHLNVLEDSEIQRLIDDNTVEFRTLLEGRETTIRAKKTLFGHTTEKMTFLSNAAELETTDQTPTPLKKQRSSGTGLSSKEETFLERLVISEVVIV